MIQSRLVLSVIVFTMLVVGFNSELSVKEVAKQLRQIELDNGRTRDSAKIFWPAPWIWICCYMMI